MSLERVFTNQADKDGLFIAAITWPEGAPRRIFRSAVSNACFDLGIVCGVNETKTGFELGFKRREDYGPLMEEAEPALIRQLAALERRSEASLKRTGNVAVIGDPIPDN